MEGEGSSEEMDCAEISTTSESLDESAVFHIVSEISGFMLYMHQQIPSVLQHIALEFDALREELNELKADVEEGTAEKASQRRNRLSRVRETRQGIKRFEKLMRSVSDLDAALKLVILEVPGIEAVILALGASLLRPHHVYELSFPRSQISPRDSPPDFAKTRAADSLSKKAIRALISKGAGSGSYPGTSKLFLLVKAPSSFSLPLHFLPKRDFRYSKKIVPLRVHFKTRTQGCEEAVACDRGIHTESLAGLAESSDRNESIWFQCRHVIKGLAFNVPSEE